MLLDITPLRRFRDYRLLFFGQLISFFGSMMTFVVVPVQMFQLTHSNLYVGLLGVSEFIPMFLLAFVGGALADAVDRRKMLRITEIGQTITIGILLANSLLPNPQIWILFLVVAIQAGLAGLQRPSFEALIPRIVPPEYMTAVSALNSLRFNIGAIISPIVGGLIASQFSASWAYAIDLVTFMASLLAVWMIQSVPPPDNADQPNLESIKKGFRYAISRQELLGTYLIDINAMLFGMPKALFPALAVSFGANSIGFFYSAIAGGALVATLTSGWAKHTHKHGLFIVIAAALWGVAIIFFGLSSNLYYALVFLGVAGFFDMISGLFRGTIWNQTIPDHLRGRLAGIEMISFMTGPMLGDAEAGLIAYWFDLKTSIISGGVMTVVGSIVLALLLPKFVTYDGREGLKRKMEEEEIRQTELSV
ncbi:MFS transporter [Cytophagaceae bacterium YF14B1]|uniref:MFS transporter n=1 Tax=Xanthocytophaga flava TaxID=3048013 RepID=A0AAE3QM01_9BACT|nr:MFS transporter [Xanthocytophaga flavus]MDJ1479530.1 MFS transporter [Xanthocytophaga flavus]